MNKKRISMNDSFSVNDKIGPRGFVVIRDTKGRIIVKKENMVVKAGRKYIFDLVCNENIFLKNGDTSNYSDYKFKKIIFFESNNNEVKYSDTLDILSGIPSITYEIGDEKDISFQQNGSENGISVYSENDNNYAYIKISKTLSFNNSNGDYPPVLSSLAIVIGDDKNEELFSRIVFDKIPVSAESELLLDYYIYF